MKYRTKQNRILSCFNFAYLDISRLFSVNIKKLNELKLKRWTWNQPIRNMLGGGWFFKLSSNVDFVLITEPKVYINLFIFIFFLTAWSSGRRYMNQSYTIHLRQVFKTEWPTNTIKAMFAWHPRGRIFGGLNFCTVNVVPCEQNIN